MVPTTPDPGALAAAAARPLLLLVLAACGAGASRDATPRSTTTTTTSRYGADAIDGQNRAPAGAATAWTTGGGPASPGMPSTGEIVESPETPGARDAGP